MKSKLLHNNRGIIAIYVFTISLFFLSIALTLLTIHLANLQDSQNIKDGMQARLLAEGALQEARYYYKSINSSWSGTSPEMTVSINSKTIGTYKYSVTKCGQKYTLVGSGYVPNSTDKSRAEKSLSLSLYEPIPYIIFSDNFEPNNLSQWTESNAAGTDWDVRTTAPKVGTRHARGMRSAGGGGTRIAKLRTPVLDLSCYSSVVLRFSYRRNGGNRFRVYQNLTSNPSSGWTQIFSDSTNDAEDIYMLPATRLTINSPTSTTWFEFDAELSNSSQEWYLDEVALSTPYSVYSANVDH